MSHIVTIAQTKLVAALRDRQGVSATEYTLMIVGIAVLVLGAAQVLGSDISSALGKIGSYISTQGAAI
jgi:Flp pilus assembly pilin Flp